MDDSTPLPRSVVVERLRAAGCVYAEDEAGLLVAEARSGHHLESLLRQRVSGVPLEHVLGWTEFAGLRVRVTQGVFVPRRRTELLAAEGVRLARRGDVVLDLCCGSGAIALVLAHRVSGLEVHAADLDLVAVACAERNLDPVGGRVHQGDLFTALPDDLRGRIDLVVANAPYVPTDELATMPTEARDHEPQVALDGGPDGLAVQRGVVAGARAWLAAGGHLLLETSRRQAPASARLMAEEGLNVRIVTSDDLDATIVVGCNG